ncbi:glycoside hydrolase family 72 protein [Lophiostoma macrostomum CBS 122681]|uniref:1,3-beta-glucanosyltransferase n=1 Tax=Lophiostoma macrostomum CBS 122681 TaxID=1314788 RepID=A0A6A6T4G5_9PLEO|nr:glycoside hydrolase family 72 protein [Lophiostoma macrostomum CBS 122681]
MSYGELRWSNIWNGPWVAVVLLVANIASAIPTISIKGSKFFTSDGDQFFIKGVVYAPSWQQENNNLVNGTQCEVDANLIKKLGANVIRVYSIDPSLNHDQCMQVFSDAGIYLMLDLATPTYQIDPNDPQWNTTLRDQFAKVIDNFQGYDNLFAFNAGDEVVTNTSTSDAAAYVKASIADMKAYRDAMQYRDIPIGYAAVDNSNIRTIQQDYFDCGKPAVGADFFAVNRFSWCESSSFTASGYQELYNEFDGYDIPTFLSQTGCSLAQSAPPNRTFDDQTAVLGQQMNDRFSGAVVYEWHQEETNYGLVSYDNADWTGMPSLFPDYTALSEQWATLTPDGVKKSAYQASGTKRSCPTSVSGTWNVKQNQALPTVGLSGVSTPTGARTQSGGGAASGTAAGSAEQGEGGGTGGQQKSSGFTGGAIAGIVLGALVGIALILGVILFFLKRKKGQQKDVAGADGPDHSREGDKMLATSADGNNHAYGYYGPQELAGLGQSQELDPSRGYIVPMKAPELAQPDYNHELSDHNTRMPQMEEVALNQHTQERGQEARQPEPSPHVQAQRRTEMDWLASEEARLRQRREVLMQQGGATE